MKKQSIIMSMATRSFLRLFRLLGVFALVGLVVQDAFASDQGKQFKKIKKITQTVEPPKTVQECLAQEELSDGLAKEFEDKDGQMLINKLAKVRADLAYTKVAHAFTLIDESRVDKNDPTKRRPLAVSIQKMHETLGKTANADHVNNLEKFFNYASKHSQGRNDLTVQNLQRSINSLFKEEEKSIYGLNQADLDILSLNRNENKTLANDVLGRMQTVFARRGFDNIDKNHTQREIESLDQLKVKTQEDIQNKLKKFIDDKSNLNTRCKNLIKNSIGKDVEGQQEDVPIHLYL
jgi:hypothetical protein